MKTLKLGVVGAGHLGKIHLRCALQVPEIEVIGFYDANTTTAAAVAQDLGITYYADLNALIEASDAIDIVTPTVTHFAIAEQAMKQGKHVFIEKPVTHTLAEAELLLALQQEKSVKVQVGHVERFNPAYLALKDTKLNPMFIEVHRLSNFNPRGTDVPVVLDLMIHDIDLVLKMVKSPLVSVQANGVPVICKTPDIANVRLNFENGCVANLTASRISITPMRKMRIFQPDAYISLDFLTKRSEIVKLYDEASSVPAEDNVMPLELGDGSTRYFSFSQPNSPSINAIQEELSTFAQAILNDTDTPVSLSEGYAALALAHRILETINQQNFIL